MNGIFAIEKPSGISSNQFMMQIQKIFNNSAVFSKEIQRATAERRQQFEQQTGKKASKRKLRKVSKVKMGHGGTLDPLASGVLVLGVGTGTKLLANYLSGTVKVYESEALFGVSTTSGDSEGEILSKNSVKHLTFDEVKTVEEKLKGSLKQTPPIYSALKMNGKSLHEYAREGKPLPRAIEPRQVQIYNLEVLPDTLSKNHNYKLLKSEDQSSSQIVKDLNANMLFDTLYFSKEYVESHKLDSEVANVEPAIPLSEEEKNEIDTQGDDYKAPLLHVKAEVSSGTYIRSLISDIGKALRSSCYMTKLIRIQQQDWSLEKNNVFKIKDFTDRDELVWSKVLEKVMEKGSSVNIVEELEKAELEHQSAVADLQAKQKEDLDECQKVEVGDANDATTSNESNKRKLEDVE
ncbi:tRNA pseudouridine synthase 4 [Nakaseomyces bracarensis]|uniref:tRNA pseudouridine(55) synthase n=1 Tax=Nakaseomyces bracarensis TaxID=273131 RepID=A0ABR4NX16_9SACH